MNLNNEEKLKYLIESYNDFMAIKQIKVGYDNFCYIVYCNKTKKTAIVDPGFDAHKLLKILQSNNFDLMYIINTHYHSDHSNENKRIKYAYPKSKLVLSEIDGEKFGVKVDIYVNDEDQLSMGNINLKFLITPGHTSGSICIIVDNEAILTGDTLFIGDCGRTDLPGGNLIQMYNTLKNKILNLPDNLIVFPGHDYGNKPYDSLGNQKKTNRALLANNINEFSKLS